MDFAWDTDDDIISSFPRNNTRKSWAVIRVESNWTKSVEMVFRGSAYDHEPPTWGSKPDTAIIKWVNGQTGKPNPLLFPISSLSSMFLNRNTAGLWAFSGDGSNVAALSLHGSFIMATDNLTMMKKDSDVRFQYFKANQFRHGWLQEIFLPFKQIYSNDRRLWIMIPWWHLGITRHGKASGAVCIPVSAMFLRDSASQWEQGTCSTVTEG